MSAPPTRTPITRRWFAFISVVDRSGTVTALTGVFSERGVNFGSLSTLDVHDGMGTMSVEFRASERLAHVLMRTIERLAVVKTVTLVHAEDPTVRAIAVVAIGTLPDDARAGAAATVGSGAGADNDNDAVLGVTAWTEGEGSTATTVLSGSLVTVERAVEGLRAISATSIAITVLPPR